ncbi:hypothetical protein AB0478_44330 [Streptomyces sp. NPDC051917]|uniref:hypothetical protein n=1 Tax=Streptomyces sp. NPDC051917 TaxID=3154754 RepID=UPI0034513525
MTRPATRRAHLGELLAACPEMITLGWLAHGFAQLMAERRGDDLGAWIADERAAQLHELAPFLTGLEQDHDAAVTGLTLPCDNVLTEGVNTKTKLIARQTSVRAGRVHLAAEAGRRHWRILDSARISCIYLPRQALCR